jgi:type IV secretory pathway TrbF-like protein
MDPVHDRSSVDIEKALGHGVCSLIEAALRGDQAQILEWSRRVADRFERAGNLTVAARIRSLVRRSSREE